MNNERQKELSQRYPSLKLAYEQAKDILLDQKAIGRQYADRAMGLLVLATAITGIGMPFIFRQEVINLELWGFRVVYLAIIPILLYFAILMYAKQAYEPVLFKTMNEPNKIDETFWELSPDEFAYEMFVHIRKGFKENEDSLNKREKALKPLLPLTISLASIVVILAFAFSSIT
ncbi:hypothetical protein ACFLV9_00605 [Chloroflexota bacterium]